MNFQESSRGRMRFTDSSRMKWYAKNGCEMAVNIGKFGDPEKCGVCEHGAIIWQHIECNMPGHAYKGYGCQFHIRKTYQCCRGNARRLNMKFEDAMAMMGAKVKTLKPKSKRAGEKRRKTGVK